MIENKIKFILKLGLFYVDLRNLTSFYEYFAIFGHIMQEQLNFRGHYSHSYGVYRTRAFLTGMNLLFGNHYYDNNLGTSTGMQRVFEQSEKNRAKRKLNRLGQRGSVH